MKCIDFWHEISILTHVLFNFKLSIEPNQIFGLHIELLLKKKMLIELCLGNYVMSYGLVNGIFVNYTKSLMWRKFHKYLC